MIKTYFFKHVLVVLIMLCSSSILKAQDKTPFNLLQLRLQKGWHTYNTSSVLSHVLLPEAFSVKLSLKSNHVGLYGYMGDAYISSKVLRAEAITPVAYSSTGDYTELLLNWDGNIVRIQSASIDNDLVLLATPEKTTKVLPDLIVETGFLWNNPGQILKKGSRIYAKGIGKGITVSGTAPLDTVFLILNTPYLSFKLNSIIGVYSGASNKSLSQIQQIIRNKKALYEKDLEKYGTEAAIANVIQNAIGWNTIYDPLNKQVITPVSRYWSEAFGGPYVLFDWDTYFGAWMAAMHNKDLAFANAIAITKSLTPGGFVPNYTAGGTKSSFDRSQPPVGSMVVREIYRKYPEKWFLQYLFSDLLTWNRWWVKSRKTKENWLCWGSDSLGDASANTWQAAAYESGLDNSPMFDGVPFNQSTHLMEQADVGLQSLYIMDCEALADIASILGKKDVQKELLERRNVFKEALSRLWHEPTGQYLNFRTDQKVFNLTTSPTTFYPLLAQAPSEQQANRMIKDHLQNPKEYAGEWILPSCTFDNPAFKEQDYWRGRIWGPLNMLVYLGLRKYPSSEMRNTLVTKSKELLMSNYKENKYIYENYNGITGKGREALETVTTSDNFYHWGALLGFMTMIEKGYMGRPLENISRP